MRQINPKLTAWLRLKLESNGVAQAAIKNKNARQLFIEAARACVGIRESGGNNNGPLVELFQDTIGSADSEAWCMSFVQSMIAYVEVTLDVKSSIPAGEHCLTIWGESARVLRVLRVPAPGAICIWKHGSGPSGHTGIVLEYGKKVMNLVEGNTEAGFVNGAVERDGGGVYYTERNILGTGNMRVVGFLKPF
jgi:hypothetical protein